jgi:hypothetical protein
MLDLKEGLSDSRRTSLKAVMLVVAIKSTLSSTTSRWLQWWMR